MSSLLPCSVTAVLQPSALHGVVLRLRKPTEKKVQWRRLSVYRRRKSTVVGKSWLDERYFDPPALVIRSAFSGVQIERFASVFSGLLLHFPQLGVLRYTVNKCEMVALKTPRKLTLHHSRPFHPLFRFLYHSCVFVDLFLVEWYVGKKQQ